MIDAGDETAFADHGSQTAQLGPHGVRPAGDDAFVEPAADSQRLIAVGASFVEEIRLPDGSHLIMLRDPWGLALQLCRRAQGLLAG